VEVFQRRSDEKVWLNRSSEAPEFNSKGIFNKISVTCLQEQLFALDISSFVPSVLKTSAVRYPFRSFGR
jgi:hypothetical protein